MAFPLSRQISLKTKSWKRYHHHLNNHSGSSQASYGRRITPPESFHQPKGNAAARWIGQIKYAQKITLRNIYGSAELYRPLKKKSAEKKQQLRGRLEEANRGKTGKRDLENLIPTTYTCEISQSWIANQQQQQPRENLTRQGLVFHWKWSDLSVRARKWSNFGLWFIFVYFHTKIKIINNVFNNDSGETSSLI